MFKFIVVMLLFWCAGELYTINCNLKIFSRMAQIIYTGK